MRYNNNKLYYTAKLLNCDKLCVCCYRHLLDDVFKYQRIDCDGLFVREFADGHHHKKEEVFLLDLQLISSSIFIIASIVSLLITYNEKLTVTNRKKLFTNKEDKY